MTKKTNTSDDIYTDEPLGNFEIIEDFLPKPWELAQMEKKTKVTISLGESSVNYFKALAKEHGVSYQAMIRNLLQLYAMRAGK